MKAEQVDKALQQKFIAENARLVFWHDADGEFTEYVRDGLAGDIADVKVLDVAEVGGLSAKLRLEREDPAGKYLVYSKGEASPADEDWLLDIRLYSSQFHADVASLWLQELGLSSLSLRDHLKARATFLGNQDRRKKLRRFISEGDDEAAIDLKMMAVLAGSDVAISFDVLRSLCHGHEEDGRFDLDEPPAIMATFEKMGLLEGFWRLMRSEFAYESDTPTIASLVRRLFVSDLLHSTDDVGMRSLAHHQLPKAGRRNAVVFLAQWRDSSGTASSYDAAAAAVEAEQNVGECLESLGLDAIRNVYTFWGAEKRVLSSLKERLLDDTHPVDVESVTNLASERKAGHWLNGPGSNSPERRAVADAYDALVAAAELFALSKEHDHSLSFDAPGALLAAYQEELHHFDRLYRRFWARARIGIGQGWDLLKTLADKVERVYDQGFLQPLGVEWSRLLDAGFLREWSLESLPNQQYFYRDNIRPHLRGYKRAFVIISDAFRYEAATELTESLNGRFGLKAGLSAMLGVLPSCTALGMASLLPHDTISYGEKGEVLVDNKPSAGTEARDKQIAAFAGGMACQAKDLRAKRLEEARDFTRDKKVVYIYHNVVDTRGDKAHTEDETFEAVTDCIDELVELVEFCVNRLSASKVWVTADHGFLFQQDSPAETDRTKLTQKPASTLKYTNRYLIGRDLGPTTEAHHGSTDVTAGAEGGMEFWVPRATNRFHFGGGARYVHGGAMPQEVVVPLITVTHVRGKKKPGTRSEKVSVQVLGSNHKITTPTYRFELIQTEAVGERRKPITLRAAVYEGARPVTSIETVTFDSTSDSMEERKKTIRLELRSGTYDKTTPYRLVLRDADNDAEVQTIPVVIDRSFDDDF